MPEHDHLGAASDSLGAISRRVTRLEELVGFSDHSQSVLAASYQEINRELVALIKRVDQLERRLEVLARAGDQDPPPEAQP